MTFCDNYVNYHVILIILSSMLSAVTHKISISLNSYWNTSHHVLSLLSPHLLKFATFEKILLFSVLFFSRPRSEGWPHHVRTFSIYFCPLSFWLTLPRGVLSTSWCHPSRPCVVFLACVHLALFLALFLSPGNSLVSSWCDHSMLASLLWLCLTVPSLLQLC